MPQLAQQPSQGVDAGGAGGHPLGTEAVQGLHALLLDRFDEKLNAYGGNMKRAAIELAKDWRTDRMLRRLEALLAVADKDASLIITGNGDVVEPEQGLIAIGSGGNYALSAARALMENTELSAREIVQKSLNIAADICVFTNHHQTIEELNYA